MFWKIGVIGVGITFSRFLFGLHQGEIDLDGLLPESLWSASGVGATMHSLFMKKGLRPDRPQSE